MTAALEASLVVHRGSFVVDAALRLEPGQTLAVLGPNGAGKSTLLAALAGLVRLDSGRIAVAGRTIASRCLSGSSDRSVPPEHRRIGLLGQRPLLFPHLSALENIAFGRQAQGIRRRIALAEAAEWLDAVGLEGLGHRKPAALSGGQQQRVAIARALAARPEVLLLDEPMAALDVQTASLIRQLLRETLTVSGIAAVLVTHDVLDAIVLGSRVAIMQEGRIVDDGPKERVLGRPRNQFIAALAGVNLVEGTADAGGSVLLADGRRFTGPATTTPPAQGSTVCAVFRPSSVRVQRADRPALGPAAGVATGVATGETTATNPVRSPGGGLQNGWETTIAALEPSPGGIRIRTDDVPGIVADLPPLQVADLGLQAGERIWCTVDPAEVSIHPR